MLIEGWPSPWSFVLLRSGPSLSLSPSLPVTKGAKRLSVLLSAATSSGNTALAKKDIYL